MKGREDFQKYFMCGNYFCMHGGSSNKKWALTKENS
jgi:hypothetical protein